MNKDATVMVPFLRSCIEQGVEFSTYIKYKERYFMFDSKVENGVKVEIKFNDDYDGDDGFFKCSVGNFGFYESPIEVLPKFLRDVVSPILGIEIGKPDDKDM